MIKQTVEKARLVLESTVWVQRGADRTTVGTDHAVMIPAYTPHAWGNDSADTAKLSGAFVGRWLELSNRMRFNDDSPERANPKPPQPCLDELQSFGPNGSP